MGELLYVIRGLCDGDTTSHKQASQLPVKQNIHMVMNMDLDLAWNSDYYDRDCDCDRDRDRPTAAYSRQPSPAAAWPDL